MDKKVSFKLANQKEFEDVVIFSTEQFIKKTQENLGVSREEAEKKSQINRILPDGYKTPNHEIYLIYNENNFKIGHFWVHYKGERLNEAFGYDIYLIPEFRNKGYGKLLFSDVKSFFAGKGIDTLNIHVFSDNLIARKLYTSVGFKEKSLYMSLKI